MSILKWEAPRGLGYRPEVCAKSVFPSVTYSPTIPQVGELRNRMAILIFASAAETQSTSATFHEGLARAPAPTRTIWPTQRKEPERTSPGSLTTAVKTGPIACRLDLSGFRLPVARTPPRSRSRPAFEQRRRLPDEGPTVTALLDLNAGGQRAAFPVQGMLQVHYVDHLKAVRPRLDIGHLKAGHASIF